MFFWVSVGIINELSADVKAALVGPSRRISTVNCNTECRLPCRSTSTEQRRRIQRERNDYGGRSCVGCCALRHREWFVVIRQFIWPIRMFIGFSLRLCTIANTGKSTFKPYLPTLVTRTRPLPWKFLPSVAMCTHVSEMSLSHRPPKNTAAPSQVVTGVGGSSMLEPGADQKVEYFLRRSY